MFRSLAAAPVMLAIACAGPHAPAANSGGPLLPRLAVEKRPDPVDPATACAPATAGPVPLRRLTRDQYIYTVTDLLDLQRSAKAAGSLRGISVVAGTTLPADETVGPFRSNVVAKTTELDALQLMESAERLSDVAAQQYQHLLLCPEPVADACTLQFIDRFGLRAFRRPLRPDETARYARLFRDETAAAGAKQGVRAVVRTMLQSPYFLLHTRDDGEAVADGVVALGPYALASRLSYLFWVSMPDDALLAAAAAGALATPEGLRRQAVRLLADDKARRGLAAFHLQWLGVEDVASLPKQSKQFPSWKGGVGGSALGEALLHETETFVDHVIRSGDGKFDTLMTAPFSWLQGPLFEHYGVPKPEHAESDQLVALDPTQRAGLLTQGSVMAYHAHALQTSPVARGVLIRRHVLCQDLPDPPPNVNNTPPDPDGKLTTRERFEEHRLSGTCGRCHKLIDPIGFGFENYDAIGRYRTVDAGHPVDASGALTDAGGADRDFVGGVAMSKLLAGNPQVRACYVRQWFRYALGRFESDPDACTLTALTESFAATDRDVRELLLAIPTTVAFRLRRVDPPGTTASR